MGAHKQITIKFNEMCYFIRVSWSASDSDYDKMLQELKDCVKDFGIKYMRNKFESLIYDFNQRHLTDEFSEYEEKLTDPGFSHRFFHESSGFLRKFFEAGHLLDLGSCQVTDYEYTVDLDNGTFTNYGYEDKIIKKESFLD